MALTLISPNMLLPVPVVGIDTGPDWANNINACLSIVDQHDHTDGSGVPITPSAININSALSLNNYNLASIKSLDFTAQSSVSTTSSLYVSGVDLYFNDGSGNSVRVTTGGAVNATSSGISSGTNSASFVANVLVVNAAATTPANIRGASLLLGNNTAGSHYLTLAPPSAMAADYGLTLPALPNANDTFVTIDTSGNFGATVRVDNSTLELNGNALQIKNLGVTTAKLAANAVTAAKITDFTITGLQIADSAVITRTINDGAVSTAKVATGAITNVKLAAANTSGATSSGPFTITGVPGTSYSDVTGQSATITTSGRPVMIFFDSDGGGTFVGTSNASATSPGSFFKVKRDSTDLVIHSLQCTAVATGTAFVNVPASSMNYIDNVAAGTYTYKLQVANGVSSTTAYVNGVIMRVYEM